MEFVFEALIQFLGEILLQLAFELLLELGLHSVADTLRRPKKPFLSTIGFAVWGLVAGGLSLLLFSHSLIGDPMLRKVNLAVTPTMVAAMIVLLGQVRQKKGQNLVRLDRFGYAFVFAFSMALVRFFWAS